MSRPLGLLAAVLLFFAAVAHASDPRTVARSRYAIDDLTRVATALAQDTQRDAEILRHLRAAARSLDDFQKNVAVSKALQSIAKAEQLAAQRGAPHRIRQAIGFANEIMVPAKKSPGGVDLSRIRADLHARPIEQIRLVVTEELDGLARLSTLVADVSALLTKAVADASSATLGGGD